MEIIFANPVLNLPLFEKKVTLKNSEKKSEKKIVDFSI